MASNTVLTSIREPFDRTLDSDALVAIAERVLAAESMDDCELGILVTDDDEIRRLNREYAEDDSVTDVLSFSLREGAEFISPDDVTRLGEVIVSHPTADRQARDAGRRIEDEIAHLLVHGILHLLGYDHVESADERRMRAREDELLGTSHH